MSLGNPNNLIIVVLLGLAGIMFVIASLTGGKKWRTLYEEERDDHATYAESADNELRAARQRIADLERDHGALQQQHSDALASIAALKSAPPTVVEPAPVTVPLKLVPSGAPVEPVEPPAAEPVHAPVAVEPAASPPDHRPIAPETVAEETHARPIAAFGVPMTELPPAPIYGVTPLRAVEAEPEIATHAPTPAETLVEETPEPVTAEPVHAEPAQAEPAHDAPEQTVGPEHHAETPHSDGTEHHEHKASPLSTLAHLAEGVAIAEAAHLAWNAYSSHKHHAEAEHDAPPAEAHVHAAEHVAEEPEHVAETPEHVAEAPEHVVETPEHVVETPEHVTEAPEHVTEAPEQVAEVTAAPAVETPEKTWFGAARRDDLTRMRSIDAALNSRLLGLGVTSFDDIVHLSQQDEMALEQRLDVSAGYITREQWRDQASLLRFGKDDEFNERFGS